MKRHYIIKDLEMKIKMNWGAVQTSLKLKKIKNRMILPLKINSYHLY
jgi:hypothetical protein